MKHSNVRLELHIFIEKRSEGRDVYERYAEANNPYLKDYDRSKPTSYIQYLDANNLYGWAMSQPLPIGKCKWLTNDEIDSFDIESTSVDSRKGYILEVDLEYPRELHDSLNAFPLAPESLIVNREWMSPYQLELLKGRLAPKVNKLTPNLRNKYKYVLHYLQLYFKLKLIEF